MQQNEGELMTHFTVSTHCISVQAYRVASKNKLHRPAICLQNVGKIQ